MRDNVFSISKNLFSAKIKRSNTTIILLPSLADMIETSLIYKGSQIYYEFSSRKKNEINKIMYTDEFVVTYYTLTTGRS